MRIRHREEEETGELNIVPYLDIVTNLVMFLLLSMVGLFTLGVIDVSTPQIRNAAMAAQQPQQPSEPELGLTVGVAKNGFYIFAQGVLIGGTATSTQTGLTSLPPSIPLKGTEHDFVALAEQVYQLKQKHPKEEKVILTAEPDVPYEIIVHTMDATRERTMPNAEGQPESKVMFPVVWLSAMR
jgi:biopolymer transport protein ExbD